MTHLPMHTADEVATKSDIAHLETRFDRMEERFDRMEERFDGRIDQLHRSLVATVVGSMTALTAIFSLVVGLLD